MPNYIEPNVLTTYNINLRFIFGYKSMCADIVAGLFWFIVQKAGYERGLLKKNLHAYSTKDKNGFLDYFGDIT